MNRPSRKLTFLAMTRLLSLRASCKRLSVAALIVKDDKHIVSSGVNGPNTWDCDQLQCDLNKPCQHAIHAEDNAIAFANKNGVDLKGTTLFCTHQPCLNCAIKIVQSGIIEVVYTEPYRLLDGLEYLQSHGVKTERFEDV